MTVPEIYSPPRQPIDADTLDALRRIVDVLEKGGAGSGNFGHAGRPGEIGGSGSASGGDRKFSDHSQHENYEHGSSLPPTVFRGTTTNAEQQSAAFGNVVYVSTDPVSAAQWGNIKEYKVTRQPNLLDLGDWNQAKAFVARVSGEDASSLSMDEYDVLAGQVFIQGTGVQQLRRAGYDGIRLGRDAMLIGLLSNYADGVVAKGGAGSGNFGHEGRPGEVGGSGESSTNEGSSGEQSSSAAVVFGTTDKYVYHISNQFIPLSSYEKHGLLPSKIGYGGPGVYMANTPERTQYYEELGDGRLFRIDKEKLIERFGKYPDKKDGIEYDNTNGEIVLSGKRSIPPEFIEVKLSTGWHTLNSVKKAAAPLWRQVHEIADRAEPSVRRAFLQAVAATQDAITEAIVADALAQGNLDAAYAAIPWDTVGEQALTDALPDTITEIMRRAGAATVASGALATLALRFDIDNPRAIAWAAEHGASLVQQVSEETQAGIRASIATAIRQGTPPDRAARMLRHMVGLTEYQSGLVGDYWERLEDEDRDPDQVDRMVRRYAERVHNQRGETIARTETITAANYGQQEAWQQAIEEGYLPADSKRVWLAIDDGRTDDVCLRLNGKVAGIDEPFTDPLTGETYMNPGEDVHPNCRCAQGIASAQDIADAQEEA